MNDFDNGHRGLWIIGVVGLLVSLAITGLLVWGAIRVAEIIVGGIGR